MQNEHKVMRLQLQAIDSHYSHLLEEMSAEEVVPHLVQRRLLTETQAAAVWEESSPPDRVVAVVEAVRDDENDVVGRLPTFCAALVSAGLPHVAERLLNSEYAPLISHD